MSEDQISLIRSIVVDDSIKMAIPDTIRPTLRSLGLVNSNGLTVASLMNESLINTDDDLTSDDDESDSEFDNEDFENDNGNSAVRRIFFFLNEN